MWNEGGTIGMLTNGSGAAMALNDLIVQHDGTTANWIDLYGDSSFEDI